MSKAKRNLSKSQPATPQKPIPAAFCISEARDKLQNIERHLEGVDSLLAEIDEGDDWAHTIGYAIEALRGEVKEVREYLGRVSFDESHVTALEKGGAE